MEQTSTQETQGIFLKGPSRTFGNIFLVVVLALVLGFVMGFVLRSVKPFNNFFTTTPQTTSPPISSQATITEQELPFGLTVLKNPLVYQWRGSVEGTLTKKDQNSITLSKDGNTITIPLDETVPFFDPRKGRTERGLEPTFLNEDITIGMYLRGEFFTTPTLQNKNSIFGSSFEVVVDKVP